NCLYYYYYLTKDIYYFNIILASSKDGGVNWEYSTLVNSTGQNNQRPHTFIDNKYIHLVWEKEDENLISHINYKYFDLNLKEVDEYEVSSKFSDAHLPFILKYNNFINFFWYDSLIGTFQTYWSYLNKTNITEPKMLRNKNGRTTSLYPTLYKNKPLLFWLQSQDNVSIIYYLKTDSYVEAPVIFAKNMTKIENENVTSKNNIVLSWNDSPDISGIKGFRTLLTKNPDEDINNDSKMLFYGEKSLNFNELIDGIWYFKVKAYDNAGNESKTSVYKFEIDTIQPEPPLFIRPPTDESDDLMTNSPTIAWEDITGEIKTYRYLYRLFLKKDYASIENAKKQNIFDKVVTTSENQYKFTKDLDNGKLLVGIQGIDKIGNESEVTWEIYNLNKYKTRTIINNITIEITKENEKLLNI
ncbi:MAG TPA: hypothetical protein PK771_15615, partial [Spirochaetota bacterium]|nr:hypothetical protein [Spirochaetota bacterium]